jgi:hypothetical protein
METNANNNATVNSNVNPNLTVKDWKVNAYEDDPTRGWIQMTETHSYVKRVNLRTQLKTEKRSCVLPGDVDELQVMVNMWRAKGIEGRIAVTELVESQLPESFTKNVKDLKSYYKMAGETKIPCTLEGEVIFRFSNYTPDASEQDILIAHDNGEAITQANAVLREEEQSRKANLDEVEADI